MQVQSATGLDAQHVAASNASKASRTDNSTACYRTLRYPIGGMNGPSHTSLLLRARPDHPNDGLYSWTSLDMVTIVNAGLCTLVVHT